MSFVSGADAQSTMNAVTLGYLLAAQLNTKAAAVDLGSTKDALRALTTKVTDDIAAEAEAAKKQRELLQQGIDDASDARSLMQQQLEDLIDAESSKRVTLAADVDTNTANVEEILKCSEKRLLYSAEAKDCIQARHLVPADATCDSDNLGAMRYLDGLRLQVCTTDTHAPSSSLQWTEICQRRSPGHGLPRRQTAALPRMPGSLLGA